MQLLCCVSIQRCCCSLCLLVSDGLCRHLVTVAWNFPLLFWWVARACGSVKAIGSFELFCSVHVLWWNSKEFLLWSFRHVLQRVDAHACAVCGFQCAWTGDVSVEMIFLHTCKLFENINIHVWRSLWKMLAHSLFWAMHIHIESVLMARAVCSEGRIHVQFVLKDEFTYRLVWWTNIRLITCARFFGIRVGTCRLFGGAIWNYADCSVLLIFYSPARDFFF